MARARSQLSLNPQALLVDRVSQRIVAAAPATSRAYGYPRLKLVGRPLDAIWPAASDGLSRLPTSRLRIARHERRDGLPFDVQVKVAPAPGHAPGLLQLSVSHVGERAFSLALMESQSRILERMARGEPLVTVLTVLVSAIEDLSGDMLGSILFLNRDGRRVMHGVAPSLPAAYWKAIDGQRIGPAAGSCGTAMYTGRQVIVVDIARDPLWRSYRRLALDHGLRACWSTPILSPGGDVMGAFALYYRQPRSPGEREKHLVQVAAELTGIAIARDRAARATAENADAGGRKLSARELQIVRLLARGEPVKRIASGLRVTLSTVYTHRNRIFEKLGVDSNVGVARYAVTHRLVN